MSNLIPFHGVTDLNGEMGTCCGFTSWGHLERSLWGTNY